MKRVILSFFLSAVVGGAVNAEAFRANVAAKLDISADKPEGSTVALSFVDAVVIAIEGDRRFLRGVELDLRVPQPYLKHRGSLAVAFYAPLSPIPTIGVVDVNAERIGFELLPAKLQVIYDIPVRKNHGLKTTPYVSVPTGIVLPGAFPILFRITPVIKGLPDELENIHFQLTAKPLFSDEGAIRVSYKYPEKLKDRPLTLLIDDAVVPETSKELVLSIGEHNLTIVSDHYRNESRRFAVERAKILEIPIELQDPTPIMTIEAPGNATVYLNGAVIADPRKPFPVEPGEHEVRFVIGDYAVVKPVSVSRGRNYRISLSIDVIVTESE
jgi:hypothetical protein